MFKSAFWGMVALTIIVSLRPMPEEIPTLLSYDKLIHMLGYLVLTALGLLGYQQRNWAIVAFAIGLGIVIELIQPYTGRTFSIADMIANATGALLGLYVAPNLRKLLR